MEPDTELSLDEVFKMGRSNADGIGVAWADGDQVEWYKSINYTPQSATKFINERKGFFRLVHFRLSTVGGVRVDLCHPFEVGPMASSSQHGHSAKVLIHNGHWHRWTDIIDILKKEEALPDGGPWSDSRLAAYLAAFDEDWLDVVTGRVATMDGKGNIKLLGSWETLRPGIKVSNKIWDHNFNYKRSGRDRDWPGWGWTQDQWEAKQRHEEQLAKEAEEEEKKKKTKNEQEKKEKAANADAKEGTTQGAIVRMGGGSGNGGAVVTKAQAGADAAAGQKLGRGGDAGNTGRGGVGGAAGYPWDPDDGHGGSGFRGPVYYWQGDRQIMDASGPFVVNGEAKVDVKSNETVFDHRPWQNPASKRWYWIPPESVSTKGGSPRYRVEEIHADTARAILESITAPVHRPRG